MPVQARMQPNERQAEQLLGCRRTLLRELGALIAERDRLWTELQVSHTIFYRVMTDLPCFLLG